MGQDVSKKTVAILIIIAIILSVSLTFLALKQNYKPDQQIQKQPTQGAQVGLTVVPPPEEGDSGANPNINEENQVE